MERLADSLQAVQDLLRTAGIESAAIGGLAVALWGEPRVTRDVDLKLLLDRSESEKLLAALHHPDYKYDSDPSTLPTMGMLFVRDQHGTRVDFLLADTSFDRECVRRRVKGTFPGGVVADVCTAEDLIILKMISTRARDHEDAAGVALRQKGKLDVAYIENWLGQFEQALNDSTLITDFRAMLR